MNSDRTLTMKDFAAAVRTPGLRPIEGDSRLYNLATGYWVYDEMLASLRKTGWIRFAPGFKSGIYGHPRSEFCIKILGMGVGANPSYFCQRGYYLEYERRMLKAYRLGGFDYGPVPLSCDDSIRFLVEQGGVSEPQAERRVHEHDVLVMEYIPGVPFAMQVGRDIGYQTMVACYEAAVVEQMIAALEKLRATLILGNRAGYFHNDPMPPNLVFTLNASREIEARLVDFELAQAPSIDSPDYVNLSVRELYELRRVPQDPPGSGRHTKTLDQHLMDEAIAVLRTVLDLVRRKNSRSVDWLKNVSLSVSFMGIGIELGYSK